MLFSNIVAIVALAAPAFAFGSAHESAHQAVEKREVQRQAVARLALAKARAARRERRSGSEQELAERDLMAGMNHLVARQQPRVRCDLKNFRFQQGRADKFCAQFYVDKVSYNNRLATASCVNAACQIKCKTGYAQQDTDTSVTCIKNADMCAGVTCTAPNAQTVIGCEQGKCVATSCTARGYTINRNRTGCINLNSDIQNCGTERTRCRASYDRRFNPVCKQGECTLDCPSGFTAGSNTAGTGQTCNQA